MDTRKSKPAAQTTEQAVADGLRYLGTLRGSQVWWLLIPVIVLAGIFKLIGGLAIFLWKAAPWVIMLILIIVALGWHKERRASMGPAGRQFRSEGEDDVL